MKGAKVCTVFGKFVPNFGMHNSKLHNYLVKVSQKFKHVFFIQFLEKLFVLSTYHTKF